MESDFVALTDMINAKMLGMFDLIDKWIPQHSTIKKTLLQDINFIGQEIKLFHTKDNRIKDKKLPNGSFQSHKNTTKCRNGRKCWYLKQGRCWFSHDHETSNMKDKLKQHDLHRFFQSEKKKLFPNQVTNSRSSNNNSNSNNNTTNIVTTTNRNKNKNKHLTQNRNSNPTTIPIIPKIIPTLKVVTLKIPTSHLHRQKRKDDEERRRRNQMLILLIFYNVSLMTVMKIVLIVHYLMVKHQMKSVFLALTLKPLMSMI